MTDREAAALAAVAMHEVRSGDILGLGSGQAASAFIRALGAAVRAGLRVVGVPTSEASAALARSLGIPLVADPDSVDLAVDGADEVDPRLDLVKGYGGALVREKIVAAAARRFLVLVGAEKRVPALGARGRLPVEVVPFARPFCQRWMTDLGVPATLRRAAGGPFRSDNGNLILDAAVHPLADSGALDAALRAIPGVVATGLFVGMADAVLVWEGDRVHRLERSAREEDHPR